VITFPEALATVRDHLEPLWDPDAGTFYVAPWGYEDAQAYWVIWGAREWLVNEAQSYEPMDPALVLVDKATGRLTMTTYLREPDRLDAMTPVGEGHPD
jgi:hypothetical protein